MKERSKKVSEQLRLGGGSFKRKASFASRVRVFVELFCCSISSHKYSGAVRSIKALKVKINSLYPILSSILNQCRSIRTSMIIRTALYMYIDHGQHTHIQKTLKLQQHIHVTININAKSLRSHDTTFCLKTHCFLCDIYIYIYIYIYMCVCVCVCAWLWVCVYVSKCFVLIHGQTRILILMRRNSGVTETSLCTLHFEK